MAKLLGSSYINYILEIPIFTVCIGQLKFYQKHKFELHMGGEVAGQLSKWVTELRPCYWLYIVQMPQAASVDQ